MSAIEISVDSSSGEKRFAFFSIESIRNRDRKHTFAEIDEQIAMEHINIYKLFLILSKMFHLLHWWMASILVGVLDSVRMLKHLLT